MKKQAENQVQGKSRVPGKELNAMLTLYVTTNAFLTYPRYVSNSAYEAAWMEPILSALGTIVLFLIVEKLLSKYFPGMDIVEVCKETFGSFVATILAVIFALYLLVITASVVREFSENVITAVLPSTPILVVGSVFMLAVGYIAYQGLEGICRTAFLVLPVLLIGTLCLCFLTVNWWHPSLLLPILGKGISHIVYGSIRFSAIFANVLLLCIVYPHAYDPQSFKRVGLTSILTSTFLLVCFILTYHMVFPSTESGKSSFALYQLARMIYMGRFIQRLESVFVFLWVTTATVKMAITLWGASYLLQKALRWPTFRPSIPGLSLLVFAASMWVENWVEVIDVDESILMSAGVVIVFGLPLFIVVVGALKQVFMRRRRGGVSHA